MEAKECCPTTVCGLTCDRLTPIQKLAVEECHVTPPPVVCKYAYKLAQSQIGMTTS
jgi:hypothetical protein